MPYPDGDDETVESMLNRVTSILDMPEGAIPSNGVVVVDYLDPETGESSIYVQCLGENWTTSGVIGIMARASFWLNCHADGIDFHGDPLD